MLNDRSTPLRLLATRKSAKARYLVAPGPSPAQIEEAVTIGARVPDHGKIAPWRFVMIEDRDALAALLAKGADKAGVDKSEKDCREFAAMAPTLIAVLSTPDRDHKIPVWEQQLSAGAAVMNLMHAFHAQGYAACWLSGWSSENKTVVKGLGGVKGDLIAGWIFVGTPDRPLEDRPRPALADVFSTFTA